MQLIEVSDKKTRRDFLKVPKILYRKDPFWVCPLDKDIEATFDPARNKLFEKGNARRWILKSERNKLIGRVAAFYNLDISARNKQPTGRPTGCLMGQGTGSGRRGWKPWTGPCTLGAITVTGDS
jgi:hypothetical protein